jgi:hypothetical protein
MVRDAGVVVGGSDPNGMGVALGERAGADDRMAERLEVGHGLRIPLRCLKGDLIGEPLVREARGFDGGLQRHVIIQSTDDNFQDGVGDGLAAGAAGDEQDAAVLGDNGGHLGAERAFAGGNGVGSGADVAFGVGDAGEDVEGSHVVVEDEAFALDDDTCAPDAFEGVGISYGHAIFVDYGEVRGVVAFGCDGDFGGEVGAAGSFFEVDGFGEFLGVIFGGEFGGDLHECGIAEVTGAVVGGAAHGLSHDMEQLRRPSAFTGTCSMKRGEGIRCTFGHAGNRSGSYH